MSSSDGSGKKPEAETSASWGTIYTRGRARTLKEMEHSQSTAWTEKDEAAYFERVKQKAGQMAEGMLAEAKAQAEQIRADAEQQGYEKGLEAAQEELNAFRNAMADSVSAVLHTLQEQGPRIFEQWREDVVGVVRVAVQRITAKEISEHRKEVLEGLLVEAVGLLEKRRELVIRVNPDDEPVINDIISLTRDRFDDVRSWRVKPDLAITPGGMVVESESSLAEGRLEARIAAVDEVLERLTLPQNPDAEAEDQVQATPSVTSAAAPDSPQPAQPAAPPVEESPPVAQPVPPGASPQPPVDATPLPVIPDGAE